MAHQRGRGEKVFDHWEEMGRGRKKKKGNPTLHGRRPRRLVCEETGCSASPPPHPADRKKGGRGEKSWLPFPRRSGKKGQLISSKENQVERKQEKERSLVEEKKKTPTPS